MPTPITHAISAAIFSSQNVETHFHSRARIRLFGTIATQPCLMLSYCALDSRSRPCDNLTRRDQKIARCRRAEWHAGARDGRNGIIPYRRRLLRTRLALLWRHMAGGATSFPMSPGPLACPGSRWAQPPRCARLP